MCSQPGAVGPGVEGFKGLLLALCADICVDAGVERLSGLRKTQGRAGLGDLQRRVFLLLI
jgi:hypothetical protein